VAGILETQKRGEALSSGGGGKVRMIDEEQVRFKRRDKIWGRGGRLLGITNLERRRSKVRKKESRKTKNPRGIVGWRLMEQEEKFPGQNSQTQKVGKKESSWGQCLGLTGGSS